MAALTLFPLQFQRQDSVPIDIDVTFQSTSARLAYLTSPRRYAGQVVVDLQINQAFFLSADKTAWIGFAGIQFQDEGVNLGDSNAMIVNFTGSGVTATRSGSTINVTVPSSAGGGGATLLKWARFPVQFTCSSFDYAPLNDQGVVTPDHDFLSAGSPTVDGMGAMIFEDPSVSDGVHAGYKWIPNATVVIQYRISLDLKLVITDQNDDPRPDHDCSVIFFIKQVNANDRAGSNVLFRKEIQVTSNATSTYEVNEAVLYTHINTTATPMYLIFDAFDDNTSFAATGEIVITEIGRFPAS